MSKIKDILKTLLFKNNLTPTELARRIDLPQQTIQRIAQGTSTNPRSKTIEKLAQHFEISKEQLLGKAPLFLETATDLTTPATQHIPVFSFDQLYAANLTIPYHHADDQILVNGQYNPKTFAMYMNDSSMIPYFEKGCILIIEPQPHLEDRDFVLVKNNDTDTIVFRQVIQEGQSFYLKALNPDSPSFTAVPLDPNSELLGVLIETRQVFSRKPKGLHHV